MTNLMKLCTPSPVITLQDIELGVSHGARQDEIDKKFIRLIKKGEVRPIGDWIFYWRHTGYDYDVVERSGSTVRQFHTKDRLVSIPDTVGDISNQGSILALGPKCKYLSEDDIGGTIKGFEIHPEQKRVLGEVWAIREHLVEYVAKGNRGEDI